MKYDLEVDATGLKCPMPILKCKKSLSQLQAGQLLKISATDKGAIKDFQAFCHQTGHALVEQSIVDDVFEFTIKKRSE